jgi:hypothetical protein
MLTALDGLRVLETKHIVHKPVVHKPVGYKPVRAVVHRGLAGTKVRSRFDERILERIEDFGRKCWRLWSFAIWSPTPVDSLQ